MALEFECAEFVGGEFENFFLAGRCHIATQVVAVQMKLVVGIGVEKRDSHGLTQSGLKRNGRTRGLADYNIDLHDFIDHAGFSVAFCFAFGAIAITFVLR